MSATMTTLSTVLKDYYLPMVRSAINNESTIDQLTTRDTESVSGLQAILAIHSGRNSGVGYGAESGTAPTAGNQRFFRISVPTKKIWGTWETTAEIEAASRDTRGAFVNVMKREMENLKDDIKNCKDKHGMLDGTAYLAASAVMGAPGLTVTLSDANDLIYFEEGMMVDVWDTVGATFALNTGGNAIRNYEISTLDYTAGTITFVAGSVTVQLAATDRIVLAGSISDGTDGQVLGTKLVTQGLRSIISDQTLFGINPATQPKFSSLNCNSISGGATFIESRLEQCFDLCKTRGTGKVPEVVLTAYTQLRQYKKDIAERERRQVNTVELKSGRKALVYEYEGQEVALMADRFVKNGQTFSWRKEDVVQYEARPLDWWAPGGVILHNIPRTTRQYGLLFGLIELAPRLRNASWFSTTWSTAG